MKHARPRLPRRRPPFAIRVAIPVCVMAAAIAAIVVGLPGRGPGAAPGRRIVPSIGALAQIANSKEFAGTNAVGALFSRSGTALTGHFCSASVVHSPKGNLLVTAAHCVEGRGLQSPSSVVFAPGYHAGKFPLGIWEVTAEFVTARWTAQHDPNDDVAFLTVAAAGTSVEKAAGAEQLSSFTELPAQAKVIGYPDTTEQPVACTAPAVPYQVGGLRQLMFTCNGYTNGTSGGPFLTNIDPATGDGTIIGVIGGYQEGGYTPTVSYSTEFLENVEALYLVAIASA